MVAVKFAGSSIRSRLNELKPGSENERLYTPGRRSTIVYWPWPFETTDRVFSMSTSLDASTVTPGRTAPDASLTVPAMALCALAGVGKSVRETSAANAENKTRLVMPVPLEPENHAREEAASLEREATADEDRNPQKIALGDKRPSGVERLSRALERRGPIDTARGAA